MTTDNPLLFSTIADSEDPDKLRRIMSNARDRGAQDVVDAALHRLVTILPTAQKGTIPYDVWRTIHAFEEVLTQERQRTTRLSRTRQAIQRKGEIETIKDLVRKPKPSEGFAMLMERGMLELSFEALVAYFTQSCRLFHRKAAACFRQSCHPTERSDAACPDLTFR